MIIVAVSCGTGTVTLITRLEKLGETHARPDGCLGDLALKTTKNLPSWDSVPTTEMMEDFDSRTQCLKRVDCTSLERMFVTYLDRVVRKNIHCVFMGNICQLPGGFFQRHAYPIILWVRHPLHAMISLYCHRHRKLQDKHGDGRLEDCVEAYGNHWNNTVRDCFGARIVRYENPVCRLALEKKIFAKWYPRYNPGVLAADAEERLKECVLENYQHIYKKWDVQKLQRSIAKKKSARRKLRRRLRRSSKIRIFAKHSYKWDIKFPRRKTIR